MDEEIRSVLDSTPRSSGTPSKHGTALEGEVKSKLNVLSSTGDQDQSGPIDSTGIEAMEVSEPPQSARIQSLEGRIGSKDAKTYRWLVMLSEFVEARPAWENYRRELDTRMSTITFHQNENTDMPLLYNDLALSLRSYLAPTAKLRLKTAEGFLIGDSYKLLFIGCEQEAEILFTMQPEPRVIRQNLTLKLTPDRFHVLLLEGFEDLTSPRMQRIGACDLSPRRLLSDECILDFDLAGIKITFKISIEAAIK